MQPRVPSYLRLRELRALFSLRDLRLVHGMSDGTARNALVRWRKDGLVEPVGPKVGWYYNLVTMPTAKQELLGEAVKAVFGSPIVLGMTILHDRGWTTQIPQLVTVAVPQSRTYPQIDGVELYGRPAEWFAQVHRGVKRQSETMPFARHGMLELPPEYALADMIKHRDTLHNLAPDDIMIPDYQVRPKLLREAFISLEVPPDEYEPFLGASEIELPRPWGY